MFDFNDSLNGFTPLSLISFPVDVMRYKKGDLFMDVYGVSSLSSQPRLSSVSVVFDFNALINDVAPVSPISLSVDMKRKGKEWIVDGCLWCVFFSFIFTTQT